MGFRAIIAEGRGVVIGWGEGLGKKAFSLRASFHWPSEASGKITAGGRRATFILYFAGREEGSLAFFELCGGGSEEAVVEVEDALGGIVPG